MGIFVGDRNGITSVNKQGIYSNVISKSNRLKIQQKNINKYINMKKKVL